MKPVTVYSNWGYWDQLDGKNLKDQELLRVQWPDGSVTDEIVRIKKTSYESGNEGTIPTHRAYVEAQVRGVAVDVFLGQEGIGCERDMRGAGDDDAKPLPRKLGRMMHDRSITRSCIGHQCYQRTNGLASMVGDTLLGTIAAVVDGVCVFTVDE